VSAKVPMPLDKHDWHPSVLPGQVVLVSTVDEDGAPNVAPKSWITMAAFGGPVLAFGCHVSHATYRNAAATGQFVVNVPPAELAERVWELPQRHGAERLAHAGFTLLPAQKVRPPLVGECRAHLECALDDVKHYDAEVFVFGRVVAASADEEVLDGDVAARYARLRPFFFLEDRVYGPLAGARSVAAQPPLH
jgi:flavin reductase (DIM6/NTAB) family NADH-FMN oxidoreductase RutF